MIHVFRVLGFRVKGHLFAPTTFDICSCQGCLHQKPTHTHNLIVVRRESRNGKEMESTAVFGIIIAGDFPGPREDHLLFE